MRKIIIAILLIVSIIVGSQTFIIAGEDDTAWIAKCMQDNKKEGASTETVMKYCQCMNDKMSDNETQSITEWEKSHPKEMAECEKEAGWK
ncbi:MAG: hypothetical protein HQK63_16170 [Desulfamplus sp.]|nr:hypothetical protein [Desulfamplus sp.]